MLTSYANEWEVNKRFSFLVFLPNLEHKDVKVFSPHGCLNSTVPTPLRTTLLKAWHFRISQGQRSPTHDITSPRACLWLLARRTQSHVWGCWGLRVSECRGQRFPDHGPFTLKFVPRLSSAFPTDSVA